MPSSPQAPVSRRKLLGGAAAVAAGTAAGVNPFSALSAAAAQGRPPRNAGATSGGYGALQAKAPLALTPSPELGGAYSSSSTEWLALPEGFEYVVLGMTGTTMTDGNRTPQALDGMGAFDVGGGRVRLVRNHENRDGALPPIGGGTNAYDPLGGGGNTTLELSFPGGIPTLERDFVSLNGTIVNCAGGETPWGSWISCEETTETRGGIPHGYNFEIPASVDGPVDPVPLKTMGRFVHEAVAVDPATGIVYETEDRNTSGFYRFVPDQPGNLAAGGRLEMLKIKGIDGYDTRSGQPAARSFPVEWVLIDDPDPADASSDSLAVYKQGAAKGGAVFARLEGCWYGNGSIYFTATSGGEVGHGQVWEYKPAGRSGGFLKLVFETPDPEVLSFPDNIAVTPRGGVLLCEDTGYRRTAGSFLGNGSLSPFAEQFLKGLTRDGRIFDFAVNLLDNKEWAGACFSGDGQYLFVNTQGETREPGSVPGRTYAIWGPWDRGAL